MKREVFYIYPFIFKYMKTLPDNVRNTLDEMRSRSRLYLEVKVIKGQYCLFESRGVYDRERHGSRKQTHYLGRIDENGIFIEARHRSPGIAKRRYVQATKTERLILEHMSSDCRAPLAEISRRAGLRRSYVYKRVRDLEARLGIRYIAELNIGRFGYSYYFAFVRAKSLMHGTALREALEKEPLIQLAATLNGRYNLLVCFLAKNELDAHDFITRLIKFSGLQRCVAEWHITYALFDYGFIPLRDEFFELLRERVWNKSRDKPRKGADDLLYREYVVLKELNSDGNADFAGIDRKYRLDKGASQYTYYKLKKNGTIRRMSITMSQLPFRYVGLLPLRMLHGERLALSEEKLAEEINGYAKVLSARYVFACRIGAPYGMLLALPVFGEDDLRIAEERLAARIKGAKTGRPMVVVGMPVGSLCYRMPLH